MVNNLFYNVTPKKCIQPMWAYALVVVGLAWYPTLPGQLAHIIYLAYGDCFKDGSLEMSADAYDIYMEDWATEILSNPNFFTDKLC